MQDKPLLIAILLHAQRAKRKFYGILRYELPRYGARYAKRRRLWRRTGPFGNIVSWYDKTVLVEFDADKVIRAVNKQLEKLEKENDARPRNL